MSVFGVQLNTDIGGPGFYRSSGATPKAGVIVIAQDIDGNDHYLLHSSNKDRKLQATISSAIQFEAESNQVKENWLAAALRAANEGLFCTSTDALSGVDASHIPTLRYYFDTDGEEHPLNTLHHIAVEDIDGEHGPLNFIYTPGESACASYTLRLQGKYSTNQLQSFSESLSYISDQRNKAYNTLLLETKHANKTHPFLTIDAFSEQKIFSFFSHKDIVEAVYKHTSTDLEGCLPIGQTVLPVSHDALNTLEKIASINRAVEAKSTEALIKPTASALTYALCLFSHEADASTTAAEATYNAYQSVPSPS
tara:strand:+ start:491 stop:1417 length:927 start_codon:yes stop_codon:yes gene_type:complete